jgi:hypothetical protein
MDRIDCWMSDKNKPQLKDTPKGAVMEVRVTVQAFAYDHWVAAGRPEGQAPERYVLSTLSIWDEPLQQYVQKIYDKAMGTLESKDPRPHIHVIGKWKERVYNGKTYADIVVNEASPLLFGPLSKRGGSNQG